MKILLFANTDWYLYNFRRSLARALSEAGYEVVLLSPSGKYSEKLLDLGFNWIEAPMDRRSLNPLREFVFLVWLRRLLIRHKIDLVHGFTIKCAVYGSIAARLAQVPARVNAVAGMGYVFTSDDAKARLLRPVVRFLMRLALDGRGSRLILQNPDDVKMFEIAALVQPRRIRLIPGSGVDCVRFAPQLASVPVERMRVVLPARLLWDKGLAEYVEAARILYGEGRKIDFLLAGDPDPGNPAAVPEQTVRGWEREGMIRWLGHVSNMHTLFHSVDVVVLPSYREGLPKGLIEAGACGLPLVTTDVPGCREVVSDDVDGLLIPVKNSNALARAIGRLQDDPELRQRLGKAARAKALQEFDERIVIRKTMEVYEELLCHGAHR